MKAIPKAARFLLWLGTAGLTAHAGGDPDGSHNRAADSPLPSGAGLARAFPADSGIAGHRDVLFAENFEAADFRSHWDSAEDKQGDILSRTDPRDPRLGQHALRVTATLGRNTGGGPTKWFEPVPRLFVRFYCRFDAGCDYVHHFVTLRANKGLQGGDKWTGFGGAGLRPQGEERFSTALEPWGDWGRNPPPGRWNFYSYWHEMTASPDGKFWGNAFSPGLHANALTLESYITDRWTKNPVNVVDFDNLVLARSYIGPSTIAATPKR